MNCETVRDLIRPVASQSLDDEARDAAMTHISNCPDCRAALRGAEALSELRLRETIEPNNQFFDRVIKVSSETKSQASGHGRFWVGAGFGGAIAASLIALAFTLGWINPQISDDSRTAEFVVTLDDPRQMNLAFETDQNLDGAIISIMLSGDVQIAGYGMQRELSWSEDLDAGINRLSLPVFANGIDGGQMVVRLQHPLSEQLFVVNLFVET
jgi:hypothetical protein